ncbi:MAG: LamG-like jellyroll fold domain-containing protein [Archangium sp.]|nr:LamG-like jellyroll fold domain-containing protein [Archangium sp.]
MGGVNEAGRYSTGVLIGAGASGEVYRAWDQHARCWVALKFLRNNEPRLIERLFREAHAQAVLSHPSVCRVYEVGEVDGRHFIAMQLIEGQSLDTVLGRLTVRQRIELLCDVAEAVHQANERGLVHRDLKPSNVLIEFAAGGPRAYITDFGVVHEAGLPRLTRAGEIIGTPSFMAPEQARAEDPQVSAATDVYGLGATLFYALTGKPPFERDSVIETLIEVVQRPAPGIRDVDPRLPAALGRIVKKCLEKEPRDRFADVRALVTALRDFLNTQEPAGPRGQRWKAVSTLAAAVVVLTAVALPRGVAAPCAEVPRPIARWDGEGQGDQDVEGMVGEAFHFDGKNVIELEATVPRRALSVEAWIKPESLDHNWQRIVSKTHDDDSLGSTFILGISGRGGIYFGLFAGDSQAWIETATRVELQRWNHIAGVWDGERMTTYLNGVLQPESERFNWELNQTAQPLRLGRGDTNWYSFKGSVDEVSLYDRGLKPEEIAAIFSAGSSGKCKEEQPGKPGAPGKERR